MKKPLGRQHVVPAPAWAALVASLAVSGCTCATFPGAGGDGGAGDGGAGDGGGGTPDGGGDAPCARDADCGAGACVAGRCCGDLARVCGGTCCPKDSVCLFGACTPLGESCRRPSDCGPGRYCETGWTQAAADAGPGPSRTDGGAACTAPLPPPGRCVALPPRCADGGALQPDGGACVAACEYRPTFGQLTAVQRWRWGLDAGARPDAIDVWSTPTVGRLRDANCDGIVDELDAPSVVFVSTDSVDPWTGQGVCCQCTDAGVSRCKTGVLRALDGRTGREAWTLEGAGPSSVGFAGVSTALGDLDGDGRVEIVAMTGEGHVALVDAEGRVSRTSDVPIAEAGSNIFGWGGGLAVADMDLDGAPEIAFGANVFSTLGGALRLKFRGDAGQGGLNEGQWLSAFADVDGAGDGHLELLAGKTAYRSDGTRLWHREELPDGFPAVGDFDADGRPEVVHVAEGSLWVLDGATGATRAGPLQLPGTGQGGPPTVADYDGDGTPEIGVAKANFYTVVEVALAVASAPGTLTVRWSAPNHDYSSSLTGSSVFDFEGDGRAEVIYADECFQWIFDGPTGSVRFAASHTSYTATEASVVADVDGDGRAELLMVSNRANPSRWNCLGADRAPVSVNGVTWVPGEALDRAYAGVALFGDRSSAWVGTRDLWNQHSYHVTNVCDGRDGACRADAGFGYGRVPVGELENWRLPWANNFRQNVQDRGLFDAPDVVLDLTVLCTSPVTLRSSVRNVGLASVPAGAPVRLFVRGLGGDVEVARSATTRALLPGQTEVLTATVAPSDGDARDVFVAKLALDAQAPAFRQCRTDNDESAPATATCLD